MTFHDIHMPRAAAVKPTASKQVGPVTRAIRAMRRDVTKPVNVGPVTAAIAAMRAADPAFDLNEDLRALRVALADRIEADLAVLDALDGDPDTEDCDPAGGDINDEPHDPEEDAGAEEDESSAYMCIFDGMNYRRVTYRRFA